MKKLLLFLTLFLTPVISFADSTNNYIRPEAIEWEKQPIQKPEEEANMDRAVIIARNLPHVIRMRKLIEEIGSESDIILSLGDEGSYKRGMIIYYAVIDEYARKLVRSLSSVTIYDLVEVILKTGGDREFQKLLEILGDSQKCMSDEDLKISIRQRFYK